ncbi:MAG TPA: hypothetical protein PKD09_03360 [Aggregatilinea sp.]|nr:hypothetical protein [Aggregatilinea sp.]HML20660.1 hypothetical protein [Aggregatilinea sp.]
MDLLLVLPIVIPFGTAILGLLLWNHVAWQQRITLVGMGALLVTGIVLLLTISEDGIQATQMGGWPRRSASRWWRTCSAQSWC